jgi:mRNA degradation ribonuclease J1/J2
MLLSIIIPHYNIPCELLERCLKSIATSGLNSDEYEIIIVDAGIKFGNENTPGANGIVPNLDYLKENEKKIKALVITHGHEDHIGAIPHLLRNVKIPEI